MSQDQASQQNPISRLPLIAVSIGGLLELVQAYHSALLQARERSYVPDEHAVSCLLEVFTKQSADLQRYKEHLSEWKQTELNPIEREEAEKIGEQLIKLREAIVVMLAVIDDLKSGLDESG